MLILHNGHHWQSMWADHPPPHEFVTTSFLSAPCDKLNKRSINQSIDQSIKTFKWKAAIPRCLLKSRLSDTDIQSTNRLMNVPMLCVGICIEARCTPLYRCTRQQDSKRQQNKDKHISILRRTKNQHVIVRRDYKVAACMHT